MIDFTGSLQTMLRSLEQGEVRSTELLEGHLERIEQLDGSVNAVVTVEAERAMAEAAAIDQARAGGEDLGPLAGLPITIKDAIATEGIRSTGGATELSEHIPVEDAEVVRSLRNAGAVVFGKTNLPRWSADFQSSNEMFGTTNNPWDVDRTPGGSSGGAAAAVAMGFSPFEIGTDIGGSVRVPSSFTGIYGHKPSFGVVPTHGYLDHVASHRSVADVNVFGPMARTIDDLGLIFDVIAGPSAADRPGWRLDLPPARATALTDFRVAAWIDDAFCPVDSAVTVVMEAAVAALEGAGARIDRETRPTIDPKREAWIGAQLIGAAADISEASAVESPAEQIGHTDWDLLRRMRDETRHRWSEFFDQVDVLLCPVMPVPPFRHVQSPLGSNFAHSVLEDHGDRPYSDLLWWTALIGSAYLPVTVPPIGRTDSGLPIGIQVVAPYLHDRTALAFARAMSEVLGGYHPPPLAR